MSPEWFGDSNGTCLRGLGIVYFPPAAAAAVDLGRKVSNHQIDPEPVALELLLPSVRERSHRFGRRLLSTDELLVCVKDPPVAGGSDTPAPSVPSGSLLAP